MPRILSPEGFKDLVDDVVENLAEEADIPEEMVAFIIPDVTGADLYAASANNPNDRLHVRMAYGQEGEGVKTDGFDRGLGGIARGGYRGALLGTGAVTIEELGPEGTGVALENIGRVPEPHAAPEDADEDESGTAVMHLTDEADDLAGEGEVPQ